jgi:hypothetical protein
MENRMSECDGQTALVTVVTSSNPARLTKLARLCKGQLDFQHGGYLVDGRASVRKLDSFESFAALLQSLDASQALTFGIPETAEIALTAETKWKEEGCPDGTIPRTNATFAWPEGPAVMMLDYDPEEGADVLSPEALVDVIRAAAPKLKDAAMLHMPSASSFIKNGKTGEDLTGLRGQRLYFFVKDGRDVPRAGQALFDRLWLAGHGYMKISKAGSLLTRSIIDATVWQPSRLDFAAGAKCAPPLVQDRGTPRLFEGAQSMVDTKAALPDPSEHEGKLLKHLHDQARAAKEPEAQETRAAWLETRAIEMVGPNASDAEIAAAKAQAEDALETRVLPGDFILNVMVDGTIKNLSVADVLDAPQKYDRAKTRDAFEPDYDGGRNVGMLYLDGPVKTLHSFARGGITYRLERNLKFITILKGQLDKAVDETLEVLRDHPDFYDFGDELVWLSEGQMYPLDQHRLDQKFGGLIQFQSYDRWGDLVLRDPPPNLTKRVLSLGHIRKLKPLSAVITAPTLRPDGSILDTAGYDAETQLFYHKDRDALRVTVPLAPSKNEAIAALERLMTPFADFPFVEPLDRGIFLSALLTASVRGILATSPGFGFDAPVQGSGKTLLAQCIAALAGDRSPAVYPHVSGRDDEEVRKRLMSFFRTGAAAMVWDNVLGTFDSASFAAALTSETFTDRVLGRSEVLTVPNKAIFLLTGNNLTLQGDMVRRILVARIDPGTDRPFARSFDLDPLQYVREHRSALIAAALTLMRGYLASDAAKPDGRMASFEAWSDLVRNTVCWIAGSIGRGDYDDPMRAVTRALEHDPDLELHADLLETLHEKFKGEPFTAADIHRSIGGEPSLISSGPAHKVWVSLTAINPNAARSASTIGMALRYRKDRIAGGLVLRTRKDSHTKKSHWWIEEAK